MQFRRAWIGLPLALALLAACSSGSSKGSGTSQPSTTTSSTAPLTKNEATAALLTFTELPGTFHDIGWKPGGSPEGLPSSAKSPTERTIDAQHPPLVLVGRSGRDSRGVAQYNEELRAYTDNASATAAYTAIRNGEVCAHGTIFENDRTTRPISIESPRDVTTTVAADTATEFLEHTSGFDDKLVVAHVGHLVVRFDFFTNIGANVGFLGDALTTAKTGVAKIKTI